MALPPVNLEQDLLNQANPAPIDQAGVAPTSFRDTMAPLAQDPTEEFLVALMGVADDLGVLDEVTGEQGESIEDQTDLADPNADPMQFLNEEQLIELVTKFKAIPPEQAAQMEQMLRAELPPQVASRLDAVVRFVEQRTQGIT